MASLFTILIAVQTLHTTTHTAHRVPIPVGWSSNGNVTAVSISLELAKWGAAPGACHDWNEARERDLTCHTHLHSTSRLSCPLALRRARREVEYEGRERGEVSRVQISLNSLNLQALSRLTTRSTQLRRLRPTHALIGAAIRPQKFASHRCTRQGCAACPFFNAERRQPQARVNRDQSSEYHGHSRRRF